MSWFSYFKETITFALLLYVDVQAWPFILCLVLCSRQPKSATFQLLLITLTAFMGLPQLLEFAGLNSSQLKHWQQCKATLLLADTSPNIGAYFYLAIELFKDHTQFFLYAFQLFQFVLVCQVWQLASKAYAANGLATQHNYEKFQRRSFRI